MPSFKTTLFMVVMQLMLFVSSYISAQSYCKWTSPAGNEYDFSGAKELIAKADEWSYSWSWCKPANNHECSSTDGVGCLLGQDTPSSPPTFYFMIAKWNTRTGPVIKELPDGLHFHFSNGDKMGSDSQSEMFIFAKCDSTESIQKADSFVPKIIVNVTSPAVCRKPGGLSGGAIFLIIFFSLLGAYFIVGFLLSKFYLKKPGIMQAIPHYGFWFSLPRHFVNGVKFAMSKINSRNKANADTPSSDNFNYGSTEEI